MKERFILIQDGVELGKFDTLHDAQCHPKVDYLGPYWKIVDIETGDEIKRGVKGGE